MYPKLSLGTSNRCLPCRADRFQASAIGPQKDYSVPDRMYQPSQLENKQFKVLSLVASCVEINTNLAIFEELAGRSAMVGFAVAVCAELALPQSGLFGAWGSDNYNTLLGASAALIAGAVILALSSKRQLGSLRFQEAVLASLTALSRSASSITHRNVDSAVDYVFEQVFGSSFMDTDLLDIDDFV